MSPAQGHSLSAGIERILPADVRLHPVSEGWERGEGPVKQVLLDFVFSESFKAPRVKTVARPTCRAKVNYNT